jgi:1,4-dihydroxy-6-naphthoate synthase
MTEIITVGHSPDPDDAFMFYALAREKIDTCGLRFEHVLQDIQTLNERARRAELDVTAISAHAYPSIVDRYALLASGASVGDRYGPLLVAREAMTPEEAAGRVIAIPGELTTAALVLRLALPEAETTVVPFDAIPEAVLERRVDVGLLIHEGQLTFEKLGLRKVLDLGEWWHGKTGLPLPLGLNAVRRSLGPEKLRLVARLMHESIRYALTHREEAVGYAMEYARGMETVEADRFVGMYVNEFTLDLGESGRAGLRALYRAAHEAGILGAPFEPEFVSGD